MRLFEITRPRLYLSLTDVAKAGDAIERQSSVYPLGAMFEGRLDERRPPECLPRERSLYLSVTPSRGGEFVYEVEPIGQLDRHHTGWLRRLAGATPTNEGEVDQYAKGCWSGVEVPDLRDEPWEYRALQVKLLTRINGTAPR